LTLDVESEHIGKGLNGPRDQVASVPTRVPMPLCVLSQDFYILKDV